MLEFDDAPKGLARLIYASRSLSVGAGFSDDVRTILRTSIHQNRMSAITGFLVIGEGRFLQMLEGPVAEVEATFERIRRDDRHTDLVVIAQGPADRRMFRDWNMAHHQIVAADRMLLATAGLSEFRPETLDGAGALRILTSLGGRHLR
ncbi:BLUF domain-containing protein [Caulobacter sp. UNC358MFTsu5.1]|uniref:BLUF domain-containing protein n=1 Tax=Caulobacter sp. UNC358MFTsu5.1 TaxID=1449049 RepID=UPI00068C573A|nr:BLUF domain-containing protein [Caulobacter sp. UNC358MFTsu5.1]